MSGARWLWLLVLPALAGAVRAQPAQAAPVEAIALWYQDTDPVAGSSRSRFLVTAGYLRIDAGRDSDGYLLFDRRVRVVYSVDHVERTVLQLDAVPLREQPADLQLSLRRTPLAGVQAHGRDLTALTLLAGPEACAGARVAVGWLEPARAALHEYQSFVAARNQMTLPGTPLELRSPCFLADVFAGQRLFAHGLPVERSDAGGGRHVLLAVDPQFAAPAELWRLPDYRRLRLDY